MPYLLKVSYRTIDPDKTEDGEYSDQGWENEQGTEYEELDELYQALRSHAPFDSANYNLMTGTLTLYGSDPDIDLFSGEHTYRDCHISGIAVYESNAIQEKVMA